MHQAARIPHPLSGVRRLLLLAGLLLAACSSAPKAESEFFVAVPPGHFSTYAWLDEENREQSDRDLDAAIRRAIDTELERLGQRKAATSDADLIVSYSTEIESEDRESDPYVTGHVAEQIEFGILSIELLDVNAGTPLWKGSTREQLRISAVLFGGVTANQFSPTDAARNWNVEPRVAATIASLAGRL